MPHRQVQPPTPDKQVEANPFASEITRREDPVEASSNPFAEELKQRRALPDAPESLLGAAGARLSGADIGREDPLALPRQSAVAALATAGSIVGSRTPVAPGALGILINPLTGALILGGAGALAGAVAPETSLDLMEKLGLLPDGTREELGLTQEELNRVAFGEVSLDLTFGVLGQMPRLLFARPLVQAMAKVSKEGRAISDEAFKRFGIELLPFQVGEGRVGQGFVNVFGRFPLVGAPARGGTFLQRFRFTRGQEQVEEQAFKALKDIPSRIGNVSTFPDISNAILGDTKALLRETQKSFKRRYKEVFAAAEDLGVSVRLISGKSEAAKVVDDLIERAPINKAGEKQLSVTQQDLVSFIRKDILDLADEQTLRGVDNLIEQLDQKLLEMEPAQRRSVLGFMNRIRNALLEDVETHAFGVSRATATGNVITKQEVVTQVTERLRAIDKDFSETMTTLFETSVAKRFASVQKRGIRGIVFDPVTRAANDRLADLVLDLESPQAIDELMRLVGSQTRKDISATVFERGISQAFKRAEGTREFKFSLNTFERFFGMDSPLTGRSEVIKRLLSAAKTNYTVKDIKVLGDALAVLNTFEVPNASTFIARSVMLRSGQGSLMQSVLGLATRGPIGGVIGTILTFSGFRGLIRALSNPAGARSLRTALAAETKLGVRRTATLRVLRVIFLELQSQTGLSNKDQFTINQLRVGAEGTLNELFDIYQRKQPKPQHDRLGPPTLPSPRPPVR